jgi:large subunit ribosomal protein L20
MPRIRKGHAVRKARKRILKAVRGHYGPTGRQYRLAKGAVVRGENYARIGRKQRKRRFRALWIVRLNAAVTERGLRYSQFINGCKKAGIGLNRKMLSQIAIEDPAGFDAVFAVVKAAL